MKLTAKKKMKIEKGKITFGIGLFLLMLFLFFYVVYQLGDNGRWVRDHGVYSSGLSDDEVKSIWCRNRGFGEPYKEIDGKRYCGNLEVEMDCRFTNMGDYCNINLK